jgi:hypothetical protein
MSCTGCTRVMSSAGQMRNCSSNAWELDENA